MRSTVFKNLAAGKVIAGFSSRAAGNMSLFYGNTEGALANRKKFLAGLGIGYRDLVCAKQVHANSVELATQAHRGSGALSYESSIADTDAFITEARNTPLAIFTADCLPVFLYDPKRPAIGIAHAGWRSSRKNIAAKTIRLMQKKFDTRAEYLYVGFGPAIRSCCYMVGRQIRSYFPHSTTEKDGRYYLDLIRENKEQVFKAGVRQERVFDCGACTFCKNSEFFSYRKEGDSCGRMISVIMLDG